MKTVAEAWGRADMRPLQAVLDDNVVWKSASTGSGGRFQFGGLYQGRANVLALLATLSKVYFFDEYATKEIVSRDDVVWGQFDVRGTYKPQGAPDEARKPFQFETAMRWRIRDGKIVEGQTYFDTLGLLVQQGELGAGG